MCSLLGFQPLAGIKLLGAYYTMGPYDVVFIMEAANEQSVTAVMLATAAQRNARGILCELLSVVLPERLRFRFTRRKLRSICRKLVKSNTE
jgi:hypothetical protein